jgi:hypothetical protein
VSIHVTKHACERFIERVEPCTIAEARAHILESARALEAAAKFGCEVVRRWRGERLVLRGERVVSVYAADSRPHQICNPYHQRHDGEML